jgi:putative ABC transport system permease protein
MSWTTIWLKFRALVFRNRAERDLREELKFHTEMQIRKNLELGMTAVEANRRARIKFGSAVKIEQECRDTRGVSLLEDAVKDFTHAVRMLLKNPSFTCVAVMTLALGIGANTMIFSIVNAVFLRPLPYKEPDRLVMVWFTPPSKPALNSPEGRSGSTRRNCLELRERSRTLDVTCIQYFPRNLGQDEPEALPTERVLGQPIGGDLAQLLGVSPRLGRWFTPAEERDNPFVALLSYSQWQRRFNGSPDVLGKKVRLDADIFTVIGIMPEGFDFLGGGTNVDYWIPIRNPAAVLNSPIRFLTLSARLRPGVTPQRAQAEMNAIAAALSQEFPATNKDWGIRIEPLRQFASNSARTPLLIFQSAVAIVLLIACANVAGLLLARGMAQQKELAIRTALGYNRWRIVRQLLTESIVLALAGGVFGLVIGWAGLKGFLTAAPSIATTSSGPIPIAIDMRVLAFTLLLSVATGIAFGVLPALQISVGDLTDALKENSRSTTSTKARQRLRGAFVIVQIALAFVLLTGAGLMIKTFLRLNNVVIGFDPRNLMTFQIQFARGDYYNVSDRTILGGALAIDVSPRLNLVSEQMRQRISAIPGVQSSTASAIPPLGGGFDQYSFNIDGREPAESERGALRANWNAVFPDYFETLRLPLLRGRTFGPQDSAASSPVVVISESMAKTFWPNQDPIGQHIKSDLFGDPPRMIVGIVGDVRQNLRQEETQPGMYVPYIQLPLLRQMHTDISFVIRSPIPPAQLVPALRAVVAEIDRTQPMSSIQTVAEYASKQTRETWIYTTLLSIFGGIAVLLAVVGIYGIMAHSVAQRTGEIGVRVALGARSADVLRVVLVRGVILIVSGLAIGSGAALALTRIIRGALWGVTPSDPLTFSLALMTLAAIGLFACYVPARRALKIDPIIALRRE